MEISFVFAELTWGWCGEQSGKGENESQMTHCVYYQNDLKWGDGEMDFFTLY